ncbi:hypothetical protein J7E49_06955 [Variovorax paradoxus]|nr:hypothetical protein [Variovorax paradoxus]
MPTLADYPPMLLDERPIDFEEPGWIYELKFDGYRVTAEFDGTVRLRSRNGADASKWFPEITSSLAKVKGGQHIVDGEICVLDELGRSDFDKLQDRARRRRWHEGSSPVTYCVFDLLVHRGIDITQQPLIQRKALLAKLFKPARGPGRGKRLMRRCGAPLWEHATADLLEPLVLGIALSAANQRHVDRELGTRGCSLEQCVRLLLLGDQRFEERLGSKDREGHQDPKNRDEECNEHPNSHQTAQCCCHCPLLVVSRHPTLRVGASTEDLSSSE